MKRGNEALVGGSVLLAAIVVIGGAVFLSQASFGERDQLHTARFRTIGGLSAGAPVTRSGVRVGRVESVRLAPGDWVEVGIAVRAGVDIPADPVVIVASASLFGEYQATIMPRSAAPDDLTIRAALDEAARAGGGVWPGATLPDIGELTSQANRIATDISQITAKVEETIDDRVLADLRTTVSSVRQMAEQLAGFTTQQTEVLTQLSSNLAQTAEVVGEFSLATRTVMQRVDSSTAQGELGQVLRNSAATSDDLRQVVADLREVTGLLAERRSALARSLESADTIMTRVRDGRGTLSMLASDSTLYLETVSALADLRALLADIRTNPRRYLRFSVF
jgi:phospholipid/cholesterol/gamma-HCH transport system substrate-binding protein